MDVNRPQFQNLYDDFPIINEIGFFFFFREKLKSINTS